MNYSFNTPMLEKEPFSDFSPPYPPGKKFLRIDAEAFPLVFPSDKSVLWDKEAPEHLDEDIPRNSPRDIIMFSLRARPIFGTEINRKPLKQQHKYSIPLSPGQFPPPPLFFSDEGTELANSEPQMSQRLLSGDTTQVTTLEKINSNAGGIFEKKPSTLAGIDLHHQKVSAKCA